MSIDLSTTVGIWYVSIFGEADWLCSLIEDPEKPGWYDITYRFRYYKDNRNDEFSKDKKSWYTAKAKHTMTLAEALVAPRKMAEAMSHLISSDEEPYELLRGDMNDMEFIEEFSKADFAHAQTLDKSTGH